jgi:PAS domain S-box-containing protein
MMVGRPHLPGLKLWQKGLIIISIPFTLGLIELLFLWNLMIATERQAHRENHAKQVVATADDLALSLLEANRALFFYVTTKTTEGRGHLKEVMSDMDGQSDRLLKLVANNPEQLKLAEQIRAMQSRTSSILRLVAELADRQRQYLSQRKESLGEQPLSNDLSAVPAPLLATLVSDLPRLYGLRTQLNSLLVDQRSQLNTLKEQITRQPVGQQTQEYWRHVTKEVLVAGVIVNFLSTIGLSIFFAQSITNRLKVTTVNTTNLAEDKPLLPAIEGSDEISHLDRAFHDMAETIKRAETLLKESEERFRLATEYLPLGVAILSAEGKMEHVNQSFERMFDKRSAELVGTQIESLFRLTSNGKITGFAGLKERAFGQPLEITAVTKGDKGFPAELLLASFSLKGESKYLTIVTDETNKHEIERLKREFIAMVSHDLRTPLTLIMNNLAFLEHDAALRMSDQAMKMLQCSEQEGGRLIKLVNDLLDLEKMESGKFELHYERLDVGELLEQAVSGVARLASARNIEIRVDDIDADAIADGARLLQVLNNLLSNAIKFSPDGGIIHLHASAEGQHLVVRVTDEGRGIPEVKRSYVFERFSQVDSANSQAKGGSGLGLAICRAIVEQHSGKIGFDSDVGKGSAFWFRIPLVPEQGRKDYAGLKPKGEGNFKSVMKVSGNFESRAEAD